MQEYSKIESMKKIVSIYRNETLNHLDSSVDGVILMIPTLSFSYEDSLDTEKAIQFCQSHNLDIIFGINRLFTENDLPQVTSFIQTHPFGKYYISDLGVANILKKLGKSQSIIYDPQTLICNRLDFETYEAFGFDALSYSNEVPLEGLFALLKTHHNIFYQVFGYRLMFFSKRKLLSLYQQRIGLTFENKNITIRENNRNYELPIFQNQNGTGIYRPYAISLIQEMDRLSSLKYAYFESYGIHDDLLTKVLEAFSKKDEAAYEVLGITTQDGFAYIDSPYTKKGDVQ